MVSIKNFIIKLLGIIGPALLIAIIILIILHLGGYTGKKALKIAISSITIPLILVIGKYNLIDMPNTINTLHSVYNK